VIANPSFGQVTGRVGLRRISGIPTPHLIGNANAHHNRLYYVALGVSLAVMPCSATSSGRPSA
jgi:hypothetical protein